MLPSKASLSEMNSFYIAQNENLPLYSPTWESDDECTSNFAFSDICLNGFHMSDYSHKPLQRIVQNMIEEERELECTVPEVIIRTGRSHGHFESRKEGLLNEGVPSTKEETLSVADYNEVLVKLMCSIFDDILTDNNRRILYYKLIGNTKYSSYLEHAKKLRNVKLKDASSNERLALFLNVYNMMWIHATSIHGPPRDIWERRKLMNCSYYQIDQHKYALHSILDGILRCNRKGLGTLWKPFGKQDARLPLVLSTCEPLIHFALNTGTRSTPPIRAYNCDTVHEELRENARNALESDDLLSIDIKSRTVCIGKVFKWYAYDFGCTIEKTLEWILRVMGKSDSEKRRNIDDLLHNYKYEVLYIAHDWTFNGQMRNVVDGSI